MRHYTKEEKLALSRHLLSDDGWEFFVQNARLKIDTRKPTINSVFPDDKDHYFTAGVIAALEWAIAFPREQEESNQKILERISRKLFGDEE